MKNRKKRISRELVTFVVTVYFIFSAVAITVLGAYGYVCYAQENVDANVDADADALAFINMVSDEYSGNRYLGDRLIVGEDVTEEDVNYFYNTLKEIPAPLREQLIASDWTFELGTYCPLENDIECIGLTNHGTHNIYIQTTYMRATGTILHEVGHYFYNYGGLKDELEARNIDENFAEFNGMEFHGFYDAEYVAGSLKENTAQLFNEYCLYPEEMREQAPELFNAYEAAMNNI